MAGVAPGRQRRDEAVEPAVLQGVRRGAAGLEDVLRVEVRSLAVRRGDGVDDEALLRGVHRGEPRHRGMKREDRVELDRLHLARRVSERAAQARVMRISDRHDGGHAVHRAAQDDEDETRVGRRGGEGEIGGEREHAGERRAGEEGATGEDHDRTPKKSCWRRPAPMVVPFGQPAIGEPWMLAFASMTA